MSFSIRNVLIVALALLLLAGCARHYEGLLVLADLVAGSSREGKAVYDVAVNPDPARFPVLFAGLPPAMLADLDALSLHNKDLGRLKARLLLVHGRNDNLIPYPESLALARAAPEGKARVWIINRILGHVDLSLGRVLTWQFVSQVLPDIWHMLRALDALLSERDNRPEASDAR